MDIRNITLDSDIIKKHLDSFSMERSETYDGKIKDNNNYQDLTVAIQALRDSSDFAMLSALAPALFIQLAMEYGMHVGYDQALRDVANDVVSVSKK